MQVLEYRVNALGHLRHPGKDLFFGVAIDQHAGTPPCACFFFYPYSLTSPAFFHTVTFPSLVHMVSSPSTGPISHRILVLPPVPQRLGTIRANLRLKFFPYLF